MLPQPAITVTKFAFEEGELLVAEIQPSDFTPIRYKGRIWIRVWPRKAIANEAEERILIEKRVSNINSFDALPCFGAVLDDLNTELFKSLYLPKAIDADVLAEDKRDVKAQLESLGFFESRYNSPTNAGILMFGKRPERFLPGAYTQYVEFNGTDAAADILKEYKFAGNLCEILSKLDQFIDTSVVNRRPVPVSALREQIVFNYPYWATRELLMNAIMHRDYQTNAPVKFYKYVDHIEIANPGNLYGKARPENFPDVNDYRNPIIAEAMKVLGYVNRFNRGIIRVQKELEENGNGKAIFNLNLLTAFSVTESVSTLAEEIQFKETNKPKSNRDSNYDGNHDNDYDNDHDVNYQYKILEFCIVPKSRKDIMNLLGLSSHTKNYDKYIAPLLNINFLTMTLPDKPKSKNQKYVITDRGIEFCNLSKEYIHNYKMKYDNVYKSEYLRDELLQKFNEWGMKKIIDEVGQFSGVGKELYYKHIGENRYLIFSFFINRPDLHTYIFDPWIASYNNESEIGKKKYIYKEENFANPNFIMERDYHYIKEFVE